MNAAEQPIHFAGVPLEEHRHICAFRTSEDEYRVLLPCIKEGYAQQQKAFHIVDPRIQDEHLKRLDSIGIDTTSAQDRGQLEARLARGPSARRAFRPKSDVELGRRYTPKCAEPWIWNYSAGRQYAMGTEGLAGRFSGRVARTDGLSHTAERNGIRGFDSAGTDG